MTFIYKLDPCVLEIYRMCKYNFQRQGFQKLSSDGQTDRQTVEIIHHTASPVVKISHAFTCLLF